jgi:cation transport ATPase
MILAVHLKVVGLSLLLLAALHFAFPRRFQWAEELRRLSLLNRQMFLVHCFFIVLTLVLMGALALFFTDALLEATSLARLVLAGLVIFWAARLVCQLAVYDSRLWRGNRFNTVVHVAFTGLWTYYIAVFGWALWRLA